MNYRMLPFVVCILAEMSISSIFGQDIVVYKPAEQTKNSSAQISGQVLSFTRTELQIQLGNGQTRSLPTDSIIEIRSPSSQGWEQALMRMDQRQYSQAYQLWTQELGVQNPQWKKMEILARQIDCLVRLGDYEAAATRFALLIQAQPNTALWTSVPLLWTTGTDSPRLEANAKAWLTQHQTPVLQLLAASILLVSNNSQLNNRQVASRALIQLASGTDPQIAALAQSQLNRTVLIPMSESQLSQWQLQIQTLPVAVQYGPYYVLGNALARKISTRNTAENNTNDGAAEGNYSHRAACAYMKTALNPATPDDLAARSLLAAANIFKSIQQPNEATAVLTMLVRKYPKSQWAAEAKRVNQ